MSGLVLYGSRTSPFVRRVRVVGIELGLDLHLVDTTTEEGQARLRQVSPLWKVPVLETHDGGIIFDSHVATDFLLHTYGPDPMRAMEPTDLRERNVMTVIDGALESLINVMYLGRDGLGPGQSSYLVKQRERASAAMAWLDEAWSTTHDTHLGLTEVALVTTLEWMTLRSAYDYSGHPHLVAQLQRWSERPSFVATRPEL